MHLKKLLHQLHLLVGLISGTVVFIVTISGCIYAFEPELRPALHKHLYRAESSGTPKQNLAAIVDAVKRANPGFEIKNIFVPSDQVSTIQVNSRKKMSVFVDPQTANIQGTLNMETEFFTGVLKLHRGLCLGEPGKMITGVSALLFLFMVISGLILWWPKKRKHLSRHLHIQATGKKTRHYDLHRVLGFYASWILLFSILSGLIWSFKWAEQSMYFLSGSKKENKRVFKCEPLGSKSADPLNSIQLKVQTLYPGRDYYLGFPDENTGAIRVNVQEQSSGFFRKQHLLYFDPFSGSLLDQKSFEQSSLGDKIKSSNLQFHTGSVFGYWGRVVVLLSAMIAASLPLTGFMIWWKRRKKSP